MHRPKGKQETTESGKTLVFKVQPQQKIIKKQDNFTFTFSTEIH